MAFIKDGLRWKDQIKACPDWMWNTALALFAYGLISPFVLFIFQQEIVDIAFSAVPIGFAALNCCILYSVLWTGYMEQPELLRRARNSFIMATLMVTVTWATRVGYLPRKLSD